MGRYIDNNPIKKTKRNAETSQPIIRPRIRVKKKQENGRETKQIERW